MLPCLYVLTKAKASYGWTVESTFGFELSSWGYPKLHTFYVGYSQG